MNITHKKILQTLRDAFPVLLRILDRTTRRQLAASMGLMVVISLMSAATPVLYKWLIDGFTRYTQLERASGDTQLAVLLLLGAYVLIQVVARVLGELRAWVHSQAQRCMRQELSAQVFQHILKLPLRVHLSRQSGGVSHLLQQGLGGFQTLLQHALFTILPVLIELVAIAVVLIQMRYPAYLLILGVSAAAYFTVFIKGAARIVPLSREVKNASIEAHVTMTDSLFNLEAVKFLHSESAIAKRYDGVLDRSQVHYHALYRTRLINGLQTALIFALSLGVSLYYAGTSLMAGAMTLGTFVLLNAYIGRIFGPIEQLGGVMRDLATATADFERLQEIMDEQPEPDNATAPPPAAIRGEMRFDQVSFSYNPERQLFSDVTFQVPAGKTVAIVGLSGTGKSTLVRLLFRFFELDRGCISLDGVPITELSLSTLRNAIAVVPQDTVLFNDTIAANIAYGRFDATEQEIEQAARVAHLHDWIMTLPEGYQTSVGDRGIRLSGGQRQRVAIARAAIKGAKILVMDEATSSLDTRTEREILTNLVDLSRRCTTLVIAHRLSTIMHADEIVVLHAGTIAERGTHDALLERQGQYATLWTSQQAAHAASVGQQVA